MKSILILSLALSFLSQGCPKEGGASCELVGQVVDQTGLDGCKLMIHLENGDRLEPVSMPDGFNLKAGQMVKLSYTEAKDMASICMAGILAKVTCIEEIESESNTPPDPCLEVPKDPMQVPWIKNYAARHKSNQILTFELEGKRVYFFKITMCCDFPSFLKDCTGTNICQDGGFTGGDCYKLLGDMHSRDMELIWSIPEDSSK